MENESEGLGERLDLVGLVNGLANDLKLLREGKISTRDAHARAELARQILRAIHYVVVAQKFLEQSATDTAALPGKAD